MVQPRAVLAEDKAWAAPGEDTGAARAEAVEHAERPVALTRPIVRLVQRVAVPASTRYRHHRRALGLVLLWVRRLRGRALGREGALVLGGSLQDVRERCWGACLKRDALSPFREKSGEGGRDARRRSEESQEPDPRPIYARVQLSRVLLVHSPTI